MFIHRKLRMACVLLLTVGMLVCGFTIAYFSSRDEVTNKTRAHDVRIILTEPEWLDVGISDAAAMQPGMVIAKDPMVYNDGEAGVYVRMKIIIICKDSEGNYTEIDSSDKRYKPLMEAICVDDAGGKPLFDEGLVSSISNASFEYDSSSGWFYYKSDGNYTSLAPGAYTAPLFSSFRVPVLKTEYNNIFDMDFRIQIVAQAVCLRLFSAEELKDERLVSLSTCSYQFEDARTVLVGYLR